MAPSTKTSSGVTLREDGALSASVSPIKNPIKRVPKSTSPEEIGKIIRDHGGVIIEGYLSPEQVSRANKELDPVLEALPTASDLNLIEEIKDFHGRNTKRLTNLTTHSKTWREDILDDDYLHGICDDVIKKNIGDYWLSTAQVIQIGPGNRAQPLHRDGGNWWPFYTMGPAGPICYLNFLFALNDTTEENGATRYVPGSSKWPYAHEWPNTGSDQSLPAELKAGDCLLIDDRLLHGGGANKTKDYFRRLITISMTSSVFTQEEAHVLVVDKELARTLSERVKRVLGYRSQYPLGSPGLWSYNTVDIKELLGF